LLFLHLVEWEPITFVCGDDAFSFANISFFSIQIGANVFMGLLSLILLPIVNKNYDPPSKLEAVKKKEFSAIA